jgi:hypothetical protein
LVCGDATEVGFLVCCHYFSVSPKKCIFFLKIKLPTLEATQDHRILLNQATVVFCNNYVFPAQLEDDIFQMLVKVCVCVDIAYGLFFKCIENNCRFCQEDVEWLL